MVTTTLSPANHRLAESCFLMPQGTEPRFLMWVDAVGGYLVCPADEVIIGQAVPEAKADIPFFGDLSRKHAVIARDGESYLMVPHAKTFINGVESPKATLLHDGDEIRFGQSVEMRFRQPHPLSSTGRLEFTSHHRTQPSADGVILMSNTCILGPSMKNHVVCRKWEHDVVLIRQGKRLQCHSSSDFEIDGATVKKKEDITMNSRICGSDFCLTLEQID